MRQILIKNIVDVIKLKKEDDLNEENLFKAFRDWEEDKIWD